MNFIIGLFAKPIGSLLAWIYGVVNNYGLSIIILTLIVRLILLPLHAKQIRYTSKISELQPQLKEIQERYAADREMLGQKTMELYQREGVSPSSGCLPLLIQMPIIMGLFALLRTPLSFMTSTQMIAAIHESFLWVKDLCQPDSWILPFIAGLSTYFTGAAGVSGATGSAGTANGAMNAVTKYFFPIFIFLIGRSFPAGLALYWAVGNIFMIFQTMFLNRLREKEKIRDEIIEEEKEKRRKAREEAKRKS
ncbi:MAG: YidC/Oxa1 family membrane protein insertase [Clostridia bacterium]|nr:YidC/Oxa1 family membrane protein insertase [Clostridia bacterium]